MLEYVILGTSHEIQETSKFQEPVVDAIRKHSVRLVAEEHPLDTISVACDVAKHLHIPYLQVDLFPHEWAAHGIDREMTMRSREQHLVGRDVRLSHADEIRENFWLDRVLKAAGALGLLIGIDVPLVGTGAALGLVIFFIGAIVTHLRAGDYGLGSFGVAVVFLLLAVAALVTGVLAAGSGALAFVIR